MVGAVPLGIAAVEVGIVAHTLAMRLSLLEVLVDRPIV